MSVSSVNSGFGSQQLTQPALKNALPQRANAQATLSASAQADATPATPADPNSTVVSLGSPTRHANQVGVAAYAAIMNPQISTSMRTEA